MRMLALLITALTLVGLAPETAVAVVPAGVHHPRSTTAAKPPAKATFGAGPASLKKVKGKSTYVVDGRPYFTYNSSAGGQITDHIAVLNFAPKPQTLNIYTVDADSATNGDITFATKAAKRIGAGAWLAVGTPHGSGVVTVPADSRVFLPLHLRVPQNATPGDHAAGVIVSLTAVAKGSSSAGSQQVNLEQRVATKVIIRVSGILHPQLTIDDLHASYSGPLALFPHGAVTVSYVVHNTGNALLGGPQQVSVHGLFGTTTLARNVPPVPLLLPGASYPVTVRAAKVFPEISMSAKVKIIPEGLRGAENPGAQEESASAHFWALPWVLIVIVLVLLIAIEETIRRRRRSLSRGKSTGQPGPATTQGAVT